MARRPRSVAVLVLLGAVGCRAEVNLAPDLSGIDLSVVMDLSMPDLSPPIELGPPDLLCSAPVGPEDCNNGCDDDHNGYTDADDPVCTPQLLITTQGGTPTLNRLLLGTLLSTRVVDGNPTLPNVFAVHNRAFDVGIFVVHETSPALLRRLTLSSTGTGTYADNALTWSSARDVCVFNNELIVVQRGNGTVAVPSMLRRFDSTAMTEQGTLSLGSTFATACATDGVRLYVAEHDSLFNPSQFRVFDTTLTEKTPVPLPAALTAGSLSLDRALDIAWTSRGWYGLFTDGSTSLNDSALNARQLYPFNMDGGLGAPIDAGVLHGIGSFQP